MKKLWPIILIVALSISIVFNAYSLGWRKLKARWYRQGVINGQAATMNTIVEHVKRNDQLILNTEEGQIVLVVKKDE